MLGSVRDQSGGAWSVLVLDPTTTKVLSNVCGVADIMEYGVSRELGRGAGGGRGPGCCSVAQGNGSADRP
jgi:hypothetical protein